MEQGQKHRHVTEKEPPKKVGEAVDPEVMEGCHRKARCSRKDGDRRGRRWVTVEVDLLKYDADGDDIDDDMGDYVDLRLPLEPSDLGSVVIVAAVEWAAMVTIEQVVSGRCLREEKKKRGECETMEELRVSRLLTQLPQPEPLDLEATTTMVADVWAQMVSAEHPVISSGVKTETEARAGPVHKPGQSFDLLG